MNPKNDKSTGTKDAAASSQDKPKLPASAHVICGWPLLLVLFGGAIGGGLGFAAYTVNMRIYKSKLPDTAKLGFNLSVGITAIGMWFAISMAIQSLNK